MARFKFKTGDIVYSTRYYYEIEKTFIDKAFGIKWCAYRVHNLMTQSKYPIPATVAHKRYKKTKGKAAKILFGKT